MKMNKIERIIRKTEMECKVLEATILTLEEYDRYQHLIPDVENWWWLRSPRNYAYGLAHVFTDGTVGSANRAATNGGLRPALKLKVGKCKYLAPGDKLELKGAEYTVMDIADDVVFVLSDEIIARRQFDKTSNQWETSELKEYLENWVEQEFETVKKMQK